jgi:hypothetical protein
MLPFVEQWYLEVHDTYSIDRVAENFNHIEVETRKIVGHYAEVDNDNNRTGYAHGFTTAGAFHCSSRYKEFIVRGNRLLRKGRILSITSEPIERSYFGLSFLEVMVENITGAVDANRN